MTRKRLGLCGATALIAAPSALAQDCEEVVWTEDVSGYVDDQEIITGQLCFPACAPGFSWQAWENLPEGAGATADPAFGDGPNGGSDGRSINVWGGRPMGGDDLVHTYDDLELTTGLWRYALDLYVPSATKGEMFFSLLNQYAADGTTQSENWSTQVSIDALDANIQSFPTTIDGGTVPLQFDAWRRLETYIYFDEDLQQIVYDGRQVNRSGKTWTNGFSGGGALTLSAMNLFGNGAGPMYFDGFELCSVAPVGACCFRSDPCIDGVTRDECEMMVGKEFEDPGIFQGVLSRCGGCRFYGENGWEIKDLLFSAPPFRWRGDTCDDFPGIPDFPECETSPSECSECDLAPSQDQAWSFCIPWDGTWTISTCGEADFDTQIFASTDETCMVDNPEDEWSNDDCERIDGEDDSELAVMLKRSTGDVGDVFVTLEGVLADDCGDYTLSVGAPCPPLELGPDEELMGPCEMNDLDPENIGCNADPGLGQVPTFTDIACGETFSGTVGNFEFLGGTRRDLDWFRLTVPTTSLITIEAVGNYPRVVVLLADLNEAPPPDGNECTLAGDVILSDTTGTCVDPDGNRTSARATGLVPAGLYSPIVTTAFVDPAIPYELGGVPCGSPYELTITCGPPCDPANGDNDGDGCVGFSDILAVLANWEDSGGPGIPGDSNCDGETGFADILLILATWGQGCP